MTDNQTVAIIGYGAAGVNAAIALRNNGYEGTIKAFTNHGGLPYSPILTSYYAGGEKTLADCFPWSKEELDDLRVDVVEEPVISLDPTAHVIATSQGEHGYAKCVIASGATPSTAGFPIVAGDESYRPLVLRTMEDAARLKETLESPACKRFLVSGASMVALKILEAALNHGKECTLVGMNPHVLDFNALPETAERFENGLREKGVILRLGQTIRQVERIGERLSVTFSNGETDEFDEIAVSHGMKSNLDFVKPGTLDMDHGLLVDEFMRTSNPDVYAAGDVAQGTELISGEKRIVGIWKNAALQGACAGTAIAAEMKGSIPDSSIAHKGSISSNTIAVKGTLFISAGTMEVTGNRRAEIRETADMTVATIFETGEGGPDRIVGFNLTCDHDEPGGLAYDTGAMLTLRILSGLEHKG